MSPSRKSWEVHEATFVSSAVHRSHYPKPPLPQVAFAGRSNVGKSSLLNSLVRVHRLAKTSGKPGHTRLVNFFLINKKCHFVDLPGYGYAKVPASEQEKWRQIMEEFLARNAHLALVVVLLDVRREPSAMDDMLLEFLSHHGIPFLLVLTKCDKMKFGALQKARKALGAHWGLEGEDLPIPTSAETGAGRPELLRAIWDTVRDFTPAPEGKAAPDPDPAP